MEKRYKNKETGYAAGFVAYPVFLLCIAVAFSAYGHFDQKSGCVNPAVMKIFVKKQKNPRKNPRKTAKHPLTNENMYATMELHSVILCPFAPILIYKHIISQNMAAVKQ